MDKNFELLEIAYKMAKALQLFKEIIDELPSIEVLNGILDDVMQCTGGKSPDEKFDQFLEKIRRERKKFNLKIDKDLTDNILQQYEQQMDNEPGND